MSANGPGAGDSSRAVPGLGHEACLYRGLGDFVAQVLPFIREGLERGEWVMVAVPRSGSEALQKALGGSAASVRFEDISLLGKNPSRIIPACLEFAAAAKKAGSGWRGVGEPVWAGRGEDELEECLGHEALVNRAFADDRSCRLLCPYDVEELSGQALATARLTHPLLWEQGVPRPNPAYQGEELCDGWLARPLPEPPADALELKLRELPVNQWKQLLYLSLGQWEGRGLTFSSRLLAALNQLLHVALERGSQPTTLHLWRRGDLALVEMLDPGWIRNPLAGRDQPAGQGDEAGMAMVHRSCELVQLRSSEKGTTVRLTLRLGDEPDEAVQLWALADLLSTLGERLGSARQMSGPQRELLLDLSTPEMRLLQSIRRNPGSSPPSGLDPAQSSESLARLERDGYLEADGPSSESGRLRCTRRWEEVESALLRARTESADRPTGPGR